MTVASPLAKAGPFLDTGGTSYPFSMQVLAAADIKVVRTTIAGALYSDAVLDAGVDYSVSLNPDQESSPGGTVTTTASVAGTYVTIARNIATTQGVAIPNQGGFYPEVLERALDKLTMLVQQLKVDMDRSLLLSYADTGTSLDGIIAQLVSAVNAASAYAIQAQASATAAGTSETNAGTAENDAAYAAALANNWATKLGGEVVPGQGYSAKKYAEDAAMHAGVPVAPADATKYLRGDFTWQTLTASASATNLMDAAGSSALPAAGASDVGAVLQTVRNALKWLVARFDGSGKALSAVSADGAADATKWSGAAKTVSTSGPSGGADGDIWFEREA